MLRPISCIPHRPSYLASAISDVTHPLFYFLLRLGDIQRRASIDRSSYVASGKPDVTRISFYFASATVDITHYFSPRIGDTRQLAAFLPDPHNDAPVTDKRVYVPKTPTPAAPRLLPESSPPSRCQVAGPPHPVGTDDHVPPPPDSRDNAMPRSYFFGSQALHRHHQTPPGTDSSRESRRATGSHKHHEHHDCHDRHGPAELYHCHERNKRPDRR